MKIRHVERSELPQLFELLQAKAVFDGCPETLRATVVTQEEAIFAERPLAHALVAEIDGRLVGMATYYSIFSSFIAKPGIWLDDLYVDEAFRNQGIGEKLIQRLCMIAEGGGCARVDWHVSSFNARGVAFYRRIGASISEKSRHVRLGEDAIKELARR
ncbi:MAG: GNAT family N-acetyltransferase [Usitatibacteraceae bacterium]